MKKLKLFVWHDVLTDYTSGVMFALAPTVEEARIQIVMVQDAKTREEAVRRLAGEGYQNQVMQDLRQEPKVYDAPCGFAVWGGG